MTRTPLFFLSLPLFALTAHANSTWYDASRANGVVRRVDPSGNVAIDVDQGLASPGALAPQSAQQKLVAANWQALGPFGGDIDDIAASPTAPGVVLAGMAPAGGSGGTLFRSTNGGASWTEVAALAGRSVHAVAFAPSGTAYVGTIDSVWRSFNDGATWTQSPLGIGLNDQVFEVTIDPSDANRIWIGIADAIGTQPVNVMLSTDAGATWTNRTPPIGGAASCRGIAVHPTDSNRVYAAFGGGFGGGQVWVSSNGGTTWVNRTAGLPSGGPMNEIVHDGNRILVGGGQAFGSQFVGLFTSSNEGVTWTAVHDGTWPNRLVNEVIVSPADVNRILVGTAASGVHLSTDGGATWTFGVAGTSTNTVNALNFTPGSATEVYLGASSVAVLKSGDAGASFTASATGISRLDVYAVHSNPLDPNELAIAFQGANDGGVYTSLDGGVSWSLAALPGTRYSAVHFSPAGQLHAISSGPTGIAQEGVYRRTGAVWSLLGPNQGTLFESDLDALRVSANDPNLIWASGSDFGVAGSEATIWRTTNGGANWTKVYESTPSEVVIDLGIVDPATDTTILGAIRDYSGSSGGGMLRSTDGGASFAPSTSGLPATIQSRSLSGSPLAPGTWYVSNEATGANAVYRSTDGGVTWAGTGATGTAQCVVADAFDPNVLYVSVSSGAKVRVSTDGGASFVAHDTGLAGSGFVRDLRLGTGGTFDLLLATSSGTYTTATSDAAASFCFGDGTATACPCANSGIAGNGCANSLNANGANLTSSGTASIALDTFALAGSGMPNASALYFQGTTQQNGGLGAVFGDGLRCAGGTVIRLGTKLNASGASSYPQVGDPSVSVRGLNASGDVRTYQCWYRNAATFCTASTFNLTNGLQVTWQP